MNTNTLIVYFANNKRVCEIVKIVAAMLNADVVALNEVVHNPVLDKIRTKFGWTSSIFPLDVDIAKYERIIVVTQGFGSHISPPIYTFIREYALGDKNLHFILCFNKDEEQATKTIIKELSFIESDCKDIVKIKMETDTINALKTGEVFFAFDSDNKLILCY